MSKLIYDKGFHDSIIGTVNNQIKELIFNNMDDKTAFIDTTWIGDDMVGLKEFLNQEYNTILCYSGPDWESTNCIPTRRNAHKLILTNPNNAPVIYVGNSRGEYYFNFWLEFIRRHKRKYLNFNPNKILENDNIKTFMCLNRKPHKHRVELVNHLFDAGLIETNLVSLGKGETEVTPKMNLPLTLETDVEDSSGDNATSGYNTGITNNITSLGLADNWNNHFINVVTETTVHTDCFLSEKVFKPILGRRPFMILGDDNIYNVLKDNGIDTFDDLFGTGYETNNWIKRVEWIVDNLKKYELMSSKEKLEILRSIQERLHNNYVNLLDWQLRQFDRIQEFNYYNTSGGENFEEDFFINQKIFLYYRYPFKDTEWFSEISEEEINNYIEDCKKLNIQVTDEQIEIAKTIKDTFSVNHLKLPIGKQNRIKHHFEKVVWLIQSIAGGNFYDFENHCRLRNPLKGLNLFDKGTISIHPGTHRCVAIKFLDFTTVPLLINSSKYQIFTDELQQLKTIGATLEMTDLDMVKKELTSNGEVLVREEGEENLFIDGESTEKIHRDFTYELTGTSEWPSEKNTFTPMGTQREFVDGYQDLIYRSLPLNIYVGYDSSCPEVTDVCINSIKENIKDFNGHYFYNSAINHKRKEFEVNFHKLDRKKLVENGLFWRDQKDGSTEFTYTRFLVPYLNDYRGVAIFVDNDFIFNSNIFELLYYVNPIVPVSAVKHPHYEPKLKQKMYGVENSTYPCKNWSSLMVFNCEHIYVKQALGLRAVNEASPQYLHRMYWADGIKHTDDLESRLPGDIDVPEDWGNPARRGSIQNIPMYWNWLEGDYQYNEKARAVHFTNGGPWLKEDGVNTIDKEYIKLYKKYE